MQVGKDDVHEINDQILSLDSSHSLSILQIPNDLQRPCTRHQDHIISIEAEKTVLQDAKDCLTLYTNSCLPTARITLNSDIEAQAATNIYDNICETKVQQQLRHGEITPFEALTKSLDAHQNTRGCGQPSQLLDLQQYLCRQAELAQQKLCLKKQSKEIHTDKIDSDISSTVSSSSSNSSSKHNNGHRKNISVEGGTHCNSINKKHTYHSKSTVSKKSCSSSKILQRDSESEYVPTDDSGDSDVEQTVRPSKKRSRMVNSKITHLQRVLDDGDENIYRDRVRATNLGNMKGSHHIDGLLKIPRSIWTKMYKYQKVGVRWLWELHNRCLGGLLGDEMGLGKTVQVIAFLAALDHSELLSDGERFRGLGPTLIVCPATLMEQWVKHFHDWWPTLRIAVLHRTGTYNGNPNSLLHSLQAGGVLVTSYSGILCHKDSLVNMQWHYVILDEGHKIRNPRAKITNTVKEFLTPHRLLLTGSPMQNSLTELWSLFDFVLPGKLGTLPAFLEHCATPITRGGYSNATPLQRATALQVAIMLKDAITPYMLRRTKADVKAHLDLPDKNEQVLFCSLTAEQKELYKSYLRSDDVSFVLHEKKNHLDKGKARILIALSALRKICNHPDLFLYASQEDYSDNDDGDQTELMTDERLKNFGHWKRAGKTTVVRSLLNIWKKQGHRVLLFTQGRQMMHVLESLVQCERYSYLRMDGTTPMSQRQETIRMFNNDLSFFVFLLTTRVGGLGVNLTGANRVVIYDPDWNPATDSQARERAWRIGQDKSVTIYRLITAGTIEEKIYHRQVFKVLLSNKVLEDPRQSRLFKMSDLTELFHLNEPLDSSQPSESDKLFPCARLTPSTPVATFSPNKIERMRKLAIALSKNIARNVQSTKPNIEYVVPSGVNIENKREYVCEMPDSTNEGQRSQRMLVSETFESPNVTSPHVTRAKRKRRNRKELRSTTALTQSIDNIAAIFEGERVSCLLGRRIGRSQVDKFSSSSTTDDSYVLNTLLSNSSVSSVFQHETILSNAREDSNEGNPTQRMARETARESMDSLRKSRKWCWKPAWKKTSSTDG